MYTHFLDQLLCFCVAASPCLSHPCLNGGTCLEASNNTYACQCTEGFEGTNCEVEVVEPETPTDEGLGTARSQTSVSLFRAIHEKACVISSTDAVYLKFPLLIPRVEKEVLQHHHHQQQQQQQQQQEMGGKKKENTQRTSEKKYWIYPFILIRQWGLLLAETRPHSDQICPVDFVQFVQE